MYNAIPIRKSIKHTKLYETMIKRNRKTIKQVFQRKHSHPDEVIIAVPLTPNEFGNQGVSPVF